MFKIKEETLKSLRQKKKLLNETEKNYQNLIRTLNIEGEVGQMNTMPPRTAQYESDPDRREDFVPLNLPKGPRRGSKGHTAQTSTATEPSKNIQIVDQGTQNEGSQPYTTHTESQQPPANPSRLNRPGTSYGMNTAEPDNNAGRFKVINPPESNNQNQYSKWNTGGGYNNQQESQNEDEKIDEESSNLGASRYENKQKKNHQDDDDDEYKDDFELSESYVPDNTSKMPSRLSNYRQPQSKRTNEQHLEETISMDFDKEFNTKGYVEGLDRYMNKNSPNVEFSVKK